MSCEIKCITHPNTNAKLDPVLSCKTCCTIFINEVRERRRKTESEAEEWTKEQHRINTGKYNPLK